MAGLWEYVKDDADYRCPSHALYAVFVLYANGDCTKPQALAYLESVTQGQSLSAAAQTDLNDIAANMDSMTATEVRDYVNVLHAYNLVAETSTLLSESNWRSRLDIA